MRKTIWRKALLTALALISVSNINASAECNSHEGMTAGVAIGVQGASGNCSTSGFAGSSALPTASTEDWVEGVYNTENPDMNRVRGSILDYNSLSNFTGTSGLISNLNFGYKSLIACNQYSIGLNGLFGYEGGSIQGSINTAGAEYNFGADAESADPANNVYLLSTDTYSEKLQKNVTLRGGLVFGAMASFGKEFSAGNFSALVGFKVKQHTLRYITANAIEAVEPAENADGTAYDGVATLVSGIANVGALGDGEISSWNTSKIKKWIPALSVGFSAEAYLTENLSLGATFIYDIYATTSFKLNEVAVASQTVEKQLTDTGSLKFKNLNNFGAMVTLNYYFGGLSK